MTARVEEMFACPGCEERKVDELPFLDDDHVQCASCGTEYNPLTREVILEAEVKSQNEMMREYAKRVMDSPMTDEEKRKVLFQAMGQ